MPVSVWFFDLESRRGENSQEGGLYVLKHRVVATDDRRRIRVVDSLREEIESFIPQLRVRAPVDVHPAFDKRCHVHVRAGSAVRAAAEVTAVYRKTSTTQFPAYPLGQRLAFSDDLRCGCWVHVEDGFRHGSLVGVRTCRPTPRVR
ncbi:hypothetical protein GCM10010256_61160 [Streptomyces coeruleorubidus]|nr:hypothetical protein GCM10010256_61160 [Streptomyces coeruleorubidus]